MSDANTKLKVRISGFYWVKPVDTKVWEVAHYNQYLPAGNWSRFGTRRTFESSFFTEISESPIINNHDH